MAWQEVSVRSQKAKFIEDILSGDETFKAVCVRYGIGRSTGYKLLSDYKARGELAFIEKSRRPKSSPTKTDEAVEKLILEVRDSYPRWGGGTIKLYLESQGYAMPTEKTVDRILSRYGRITEEESEKHKPYKRFEHEAPNDLWQMDFKGSFTLENQVICHPLTLLDDHSRYSLAIKSCGNQTHDTVKQGLIDVFRRYGLPKRMTMDNGPPWGYSGDQKHTRLTTWLIEQGITVSHSRPYHPQTQGKLERFHRTLKAELLSYYWFDSLDHAQQGFDWFRKLYNFERPHGAIDAYSPGYLYQPSERHYQEKRKPFEYESDCFVRKVNQNGLISFRGKRYIIGEGFGRRSVALKETEHSHLMDVFFCHQKVLKLDLNKVVNY